MEQGEDTRQYLWYDNTLLGMPEEGSYVLTDMLHTPVCVTDGEGTGRSFYAYDEFGVPMYEREEIALPFGFTGHRKEAVPGQYHADAREYDSHRGRFLTKDAYRYMDYKEPVSLNLYQYAKGSPLRYVDFDGHMCIEEPSDFARTLEYVVKGAFTDEVTVDGLVFNIILGLIGVDLPLDIRDLIADLTVNFEPRELFWWITILIDVVSVFPLIGFAKYLDDVGTLGKGAIKNMDNVADGIKYSDEMVEGIEEAIKAGRKQSDELLKEAEEMLDSSKKRLDKVKEVSDDMAEAARKKQKALIESVENSAELMGYTIKKDLRQSILWEKLNMVHQDWVRH